MTSSTISAQPQNNNEFIALMAVLMSLVAISIDAMLPALGQISEQLGESYPNQRQYLISFIFAGTAIGQLIAGPLSDALGRKPILYIGLGIYVIGCVVCLQATTMEIMLVGRFIQGLGVACPQVACVSIVRDKYSGRAMAKIMSLVMMIFIMVPVIAPAIGQGILTFTDWHAIFILYIFYALVILLWSMARLDETLHPEFRVPFRFAAIWSGTKEVLGNRQTLTYTLAMGCAFGALIGDLNSAQQIFQEQFGVGEMFVVYFGLQALAFGASSLLNSRLVERLGMRYLCIRALLVFLLASLIFLSLHAFVAIQFWMFFVYGVMLLFSVGLLFGNLNALALEPMGHIAGIASAITGSLSTIIAIILGTLIGQLYDGTLIPLVGGFCILGLLALAIMWFGDKMGKPAFH